MIFVYFIPNILCIEDLSFDFDRDLLHDEECFYNKTYFEKLFSNSIVCIFCCKFISIKSNSNNAALTINLRNAFGHKNLIYNCSFFECSSNSCGAIYFNSHYKCDTEIINSVFSRNSKSKNYEIEKSAGAIYAISDNNNDIQIKNCIFKYNEADEFGGSINILNMNYLIEECNFYNNGLKYNINTNGGAFYSTNSNGFFKKCLFNNNFIISDPYFGKVVFSHGGAISVVKTRFSLEECNFIGNSAINKGVNFGGAISCVDSESIFKNCFFTNNKVHSKSDHCYGGVIEFSRAKGSFINCSFINNIAYSESSNAYGGAICFSKSTGEIHNCSLINNTAETYLNSFLISDSEPIIMGGAMYLDKSTFEITNCLFQNNTGFGNSPEYVTVGNGGAFFSTKSNIYLQNCSFNNNTLYNYGYKFDVGCYMEGGACCLLESKVEIRFCDFINNAAMLQVQKRSKFFSAKIIGGAIFSLNENYTPLNCTHCTFICNKVFVPEKHQNEFAGAIYLTCGKLINCTFKDNSAYNACDILYYQKNKINSFLLISDNKFYNSSIKSMICFSPKNFVDFNYNISSSLFNESNEVSNKFIPIYKNNYTYPFDDQLLKDENIVFFKDSKNSSIELIIRNYSKCYISKYESNLLVETPKLINDMELPIMSLIRIGLILGTSTLLILIFIGIFSLAFKKPIKMLNLD